MKQMIGESKKTSCSVTVQRIHLIQIRYVHISEVKKFTK